MPLSRGKQYVRPVIVEVTPSSSSNIAPSSPPPSPKAVRFASSSVESRQLTPIEAWSLYHFETHARQCRQCYDPLGVNLKGGRLCETGHALAQDVAIHVFHHAGEVYSTQKDDHKNVRVEVPPGYDQLRGLLKSMDRAIRSRERTAPIISYDTTYPVSPRRTSSDKQRRYEDDRAEVIVEPAKSERRSSHRKSKPKDRGYKTVVIQDDVLEPEPSSSTMKSSERRGSLYETDVQRLRKDKGYIVEVREPESERRRKREHRKSGFYS